MRLIATGVLVQSGIGLLSAAADLNLIAQASASGYGALTGSALLTASVQGLLSSQGSGFDPESRATLPQEFVDTTYSLPTGGTTYTPANASALATDLSSATYGDVIQLTAGVDYGNITLPNKGAGSDWIYIVSGSLGSLPAAGTRPTTADRSNMPVFTAPDASTPAIQAANGGHHYRFVGVNVVQDTGFNSFTLISFGVGATSTANLPADIIFDRCLVEGLNAGQTRRGFWMNVVRGGIVDCYIHDFKEVGADTQGILITNTPGPVRVNGNFIEGAGENMMVGGADPTITNLVPSDIEITGNHFFKRLSWMGTDFLVKNLLEFKNAQRALAEGNLYENNWADGQNGFSILLTPRNQEGGAAWSKVQDIIIRYSRLINGSSGISIAGEDGDIGVTTRTNRVAIRHNLLQISGIANPGIDNVNRATSWLSGPEMGAFSNNTIINDSGSTVYDSFSESPSPNADDWDLENNIFGGNGLFIGDATGDGDGTLSGHFSNTLFDYNLNVGSSSGNYAAQGANNAFPANVTAVGFTDAANDDYSLDAGSTYKNAGSDGNDPGVNWAKLIEYGLVA